MRTKLFTRFLPACIASTLLVDACPAADQKGRTVGSSGVTIPLAEEWQPMDPATELIIKSLVFDRMKEESTLVESLLILQKGAPEEFRLFKTPIALLTQVPSVRTSEVLVKNFPQFRDTVLTRAANEYRDFFKNPKMGDLEWDDKIQAYRFQGNAEIVTGHTLGARGFFLPSLKGCVVIVLLEGLAADEQMIKEFEASLSKATYADGVQPEVPFNEAIAAMLKSGSGKEILEPGAADKAEYEKRLKMAADARSQKQYRRAVASYRSCETFCAEVLRKEMSTVVDWRKRLARVLIQRGYSHIQLGEMAEADQALEKARPIVEDVRKKHPSHDSEEVAHIFYTNVKARHLAVEPPNYEGAIEAATKMMVCRQNQAKRNPNFDLRRLQIDSKSGLAFMLVEAGRFRQGKEMLEQVANGYENLRQERPAKVVVFGLLPSVHANLVKIAESEGNLAAQRKWLKRDIDHRVQRVKIVPDRTSYQHDWAAGVRNLAYLERDHPQGNREKAIDLFSESIRIIEEKSAPGPLSLRWRTDLARFMQSQGDTGGATALLAEVIALFNSRQKKFRKEDVPTLHSLGYALESMQRYGEASVYYAAELKTLRSFWPEQRQKIAEAIYKVANMASYQGKTAEAEKGYRESARLWRDIEGPHSANWLSSRYKVAEMLRKRGDIDEAIRLHEEIWQSRQRVLGENHRDTVHSLHALGVAWRQQGDFKRSVELLEQAIALRTSAEPETILDTIWTWGDLAYAYRSAGRTDDAIRAFQNRLNLSREHQGTTHSNVITALYNLHSTCWKSGRKEEAVEYMKRRVALQKQIPDRGPRDAGHSLVTIGSNLLSMGRLVEAENAYREAIALLEADPSDSWRASLAKSEMGSALVRQDKLDEARTPLFDGYREIVAQKEDIPHSQLGAIGTVRDNISELANALHAKSETDRAIAWIEEVMESIPGQVPYDRRVLEIKVADLFRATGQFDEAIRRLNSLLEELDRPGTDDKIDRETLAIRSTMGDCLRQAGRQKEALPILMKTLAEQQELLGDEHADVVNSLCRMAVVQSQLKLREEAIATYRKSSDGFAKLYGPLHDRTWDEKNRLARELWAFQKTEEAVKILRDMIEAGKVERQKGDSRLLYSRNLLGTYLIQLGDYKAAEEVVQTCLEGRRYGTPGHWRIHSDASLLGECLVGQKRFEEAEVLLTEAWRYLDEQKSQVPSHYRYEIHWAGNRIVKLYEAWENPEKVSEWKKKLEEASK